jgi:hypothetical protein
LADASSGNRHASPACAVESLRTRPSSRLSHEGRGGETTHRASRRIDSRSNSPGTLAVPAVNSTPPGGRDSDRPRT